MNNKLPTAYESYRKCRREADNRGYTEYKVIIDAIESHTAAHTAALRTDIKQLQRLLDNSLKVGDELQDRIKELEDSLNEFENTAYKSTMDLKRLVAKYDGLSRRFKELEAENQRLREALEKISTPIHGEYPDIETVNWIAKEALKQHNNETESS